MCFNSRRGFSSLQFVSSLRLFHPLLLHVFDRLRSFTWPNEHLTSFVMENIPLNIQRIQFFFSLKIDSSATSPLSAVKSYTLDLFKQMCCEKMQIRQDIWIISNNKQVKVISLIIAVWIILQPFFGILPKNKAMVKPGELTFPYITLWWCLVAVITKSCEK